MIDLVVSATTVTEWSFLTNHARALMLIAHDSDARIRDIAVGLDLTERTAYGIVADLTTAGYVVKERHGRRNRYHIQAHLPLLGSITVRTVGEVLDLLTDSKERKQTRDEDETDAETEPAASQVGPIS